MSAHFDLPKIDSAHIFRELYSFIAYISTTNRDIDKWKAAFSTTIYFPSNTKNMVNFGFTNNKILLSHFEPPKFNIALAIHVYRVMQLRSGHVTSLQTEFQPLNCPPNWIYGTGRPHIGFCPIFLVSKCLKTELKFQDSIKMSEKKPAADKQ